MKGFRPLLCATLSSVVLLSACGGSSGTSDNTVTPDAEVTPGAISASGDGELLAAAATTLMASEYLSSLVFFGQALESDGQVSCLNEGSVSQVFSGVSETGGIPTEGSVSLNFTDCQILDSLTLNNSTEFTWSNYQFFAPGELFLDSAEATFNAFQVKRSDGQLDISGPLRVSYSSSGGRITKSSESSSSGSFEYSFAGSSWSVEKYSLSEEKAADGVETTAFSATLTDLASPSNEKLIVSTEKELSLTPGEAFPREGEMTFKTLEDSLQLVVDSQEFVTVSVDNGDDGSVDSQSTYSWEEFLAF